MVNSHECYLIWQVQSAAPGPETDLITPSFSTKLAKLSAVVGKGAAGHAQRQMLLLMGDSHRSLAGISSEAEAAQHEAAALGSYMEAVSEGRDGGTSGADAAVEQAEASVKLALLCNALLQVHPPLHPHTYTHCLSTPT